MRYCGRFAPSPTGPLHFGSLVAALASWLDARAAGGTWRLRMEDVDAPRTVPGTADAILETLEALGLHWDGAVQFQGPRAPIYAAALERLRDGGQVYRCRCSRKEIGDSGLPGIDGTVYPGTCRALGLGTDVAGADRVRAPTVPIDFEDRVQGRVRQDVAREVGDFVLRRRDGLHAYQLAVVVDDADEGITHVVRGADLLLSTPRQIHLQALLAFEQPRYLHVPVATHLGGQKLSKQSLAPAIDGVRAVPVLRQALRFLGQDPVEGGSPREILAQATAQWKVERIAKVRAAEAPVA